MDATERKCMENGVNNPVRIFLNLYSAQNRMKAIKPKKDVVAGECDRDARNKNCIQNLVGKPERKRSRKVEA
jgi:hypothetical protein